jgi:hypothetical protein
VAGLGLELLDNLLRTHCVPVLPLESGGQGSDLVKAGEQITELHLKSAVPKA